MTNLEWALRYAALGWAIFPANYVTKKGTCSCGKSDCNRIGKHPVGRLVKNGVKDASNDPTVIKRWWGVSPHYNIGYATGAGGRLVMDIDASGLNKTTQQIKQGPQQLIDLENAYSSLPETLRAKTGGGGTHFYFHSIHEIKNSQGAVSPDIDIRGHGGYVILPPSNHQSGGHYEWLTDLESTPIASMPEWLTARAMTRGAVMEELDPAVKEEAKKAAKNKFTEDQLIVLLKRIPSDCDRDTWIKIGAALYTELGDRGFEVWRTWSLAYTDPQKGWNEVTGQAQWRSFSGHKEITAGTIYHYASENGFKGFEIEASNIPEITDEFVYAISIKRFIEVKRLVELDAEQYDARFAPLFLKGSPAKNTLRNEDFRRVDGVTYWPNQPRIVVERGIEKFNYYQPSGVVPVRDDVTPFLKHIAYLFPKPEEANILADYLAYQVQHPGEKVHWSILIQGVPGNGKSYFGKVMKLVLGEHNVGSVTNEMLHEAFTGWARNKQLVVVEELMAGKRLELMNKLKPMITEEWLSIREMYRMPYEQPNRINFLFFTNHSDPILIDNTDRRYCVLASEAPPHADPEYYARLFAWTRENAPALLSYLLERPLTIQPMAHAPMTEGKKALIEESMSGLDSFLSQQIRGCQPPCQYDLIIPSLLVKELRNNFGLGQATPKELSRSFSRLGAVKMDEDLWAIRNVEIYKGLEPDKLRQVLSSQVQGAPKETPGGHAMVAAAMNRDKPI